MKKIPYTIIPIVVIIVFIIYGSIIPQDSTPVEESLAELWGMILGAGIVGCLIIDYRRWTRAKNK